MAPTTTSSPPLALTHARLGIAAALPLVGFAFFVLWEVRHDLAGFTATWVFLSAMIAIPTAILHAWLLARSERRLLVTRRARFMYVPLAMSEAIMALWAPLGVAGPLLIVWSLVVGPGRWFGPGVVLSGAWLVVAMAFAVRAWSLSALASRAVLSAAKTRWTTWGDLVPSSVLSMAAGAWGGLLLLTVFNEALRDMGTTPALVMVAGCPVAASLMGWVVHQQAPFLGVDAPYARAELAGGISLGVMAPWFVMCFEQSNDDVKWFGIVLSCVGVLVSTGVWSVARALRRDVWLPGT